MGQLHPCMPAELHQPYDLMKFQEKQEEKEKTEAKKNETKIEISSATTEQVNLSEKNNDSSHLINISI